MIDGGPTRPRLLRWQEGTKLLPVHVSEGRQARQSDRLLHRCLNQRRLTDTAFHMAAPGSSLMGAPEARPPQPPSSLLCWLAERMDHPTQLGYTQLDVPSGCSAFFSWAFA
jgi:hypothetical protein